MGTKTTESRLKYLAGWAQANKCVFNTTGEIGFGRPCVGITYGDSYVTYGWTDTGDYRDWQQLGEAIPPRSVVHAYHNHPALAVLVHDGNVGEAVKQLYIWVKMLESTNIVVKIAERTPTSIIDVALHGLREARLVKVNDDD